MRHGHVDDLGEELLGGRLADEQPDLLEGVAHPRDQDEETDADGTDRIRKPGRGVAGANHGHDQTEDVNDNVVAVVDLEDSALGQSRTVGGATRGATHKEDVNRRVFPVGETVEHQRALGEDSHGDEDDRDDVQLRGVRAVTPSQRPCRLDLCVSPVSGETQNGLSGCKPTISSMATVVISAQNRMMPMVSILVRPWIIIPN